MAIENQAFCKIESADQKGNSWHALGVGENEGNAIKSVLQHFDTLQSEVGPLRVKNIKFSTFEPKSFKVKPSP